MPQLAKGGKHVFGWSRILRECSGLTHFESIGTIHQWKGRLYARIRLHGGSFELSAVHRSGYVLQPGDLVLVVRGSGLGPSFLAKGPLIDEARRHEELDVFEAFEQQGE